MFYNNINYIYAKFLKFTLKMFLQSKKKVIIFSGTPSSNHSISMISASYEKKVGEYELWANDVTKVNKFIANIWSNSFLGIIKLIYKLKKFQYINLQHEFNVWGAKGLITFPLTIFFLRKKKITITLHTVIDFNKIDYNFIDNFRLKPKILLLYKFYFYLFFFFTTKFSKNIIVHTKDQKKILKKIYKFKGNIIINYIGVNYIGVNYIGIKNFKREKNLRFYDIIIFGYISPRKGISELINVLENVNVTLKILIAGGVQEKYNDYYIKILEKINQSKHSYKVRANIKDKEICSLHFQSNVALYGHSQLLGGSGPLSAAISCNNKIIAPNKGIFKEILIYDKNSKLYKNYEEINFLLKKIFKKKKIKREKLKKSLSWLNYLEKSFIQ